MAGNTTKRKRASSIELQGLLAEARWTQDRDAGESAVVRIEGDGKVMNVAASRSR